MRIKDVVELKNIKSEDHSKPYIGLENIESWNNRFIPTESVSEGINNEYDKGDILFSKLRPYLAKGYIAKESGVCSTEFFVLHTKKGFDNKYLLYRFLTPSFIGYINSKVAGVKMPRTNWNDFSSTSMDMPSLEVQQRVVSYLDAKTAKIDKAIELLRKKRDAYTRLKKSVINRAVTRGLNPNVKLKDSGVEWIGMIPENWKVKRIKDIANNIGSGTTPSRNVIRYYDSEDYLWINTGDFNNSEVYNGNQMISQAAIDEIKTLRFYPINTILVAMYGASIGKVGILKSVATVNQACCAIMSNKKEALPYYLFYLLINNKDYLLAKSFGGTQPNVSQAIISNMILPFPPLSEQRAISSYLNIHCSRIDHAISIVDKQMNAYTRLKKSLINEVVTGKRKV